MGGGSGRRVSAAGVGKQSSPASNADMESFRTGRLAGGPTMKFVCEIVNAEFESESEQEQLTVESDFPAGLVFNDRVLL